VDHDAEKIVIGTEDAEAALNSILRVLEWYYAEYDKGPQLRTPYGRLPWHKRTLKETLLAIAALASVPLVLVLASRSCETGGLSGAYPPGWLLSRQAMCWLGALADGRAPKAKPGAAAPSLLVSVLAATDKDKDPKLQPLDQGATP